MENQKTDQPSLVKVHFRLADGSGVQRTFQSTEKLQNVFNFALSLRGGGRQAASTLTLASMKPRRRFTAADMDFTLAELGLVPAALLLLVPCSHNQAATQSQPTKPIASIDS